MSKPLIGVCIPHTGQVYVDFATKTLVHLTINQEETPFIKKLYLQRGWSIAANRNSLVKVALDDGCDYVFFIDSDMIFSKGVNPTDAIQKLLDMKVSIASGLARMKRENYNYSAFIKNGTNQYNAVGAWSSKILEVDIVGMYCVLIKKELFQQMQKPYFVLNDEETMGEDFYFCTNARALGYPIFVNTDVQLDHMGDFTLGFDGNVRWEK